MRLILFIASRWEKLINAVGKSAWKGGRDSQLAKMVAQFEKSQSEENEAHQRGRSLIFGNNNFKVGQLKLSFRVRL